MSTVDTDMDNVAPLPDNFPADRYEVIEPAEPSYEIPQEVVDRWLAIDPEVMVNVQLPRAAFDMLYTSISELYQLVAATQHATAAMEMGDRALAKQEAARAAALSRSGFNALKHFQATVMISVIADEEHSEAPRGE
jgi:hypothetical protein